MATETFTIRTEDKNIKKLDWLASATDRSRNYLVNAAIERYLREEAEFVADVEAGRKAFEEGRTIPHEEVFRALRAKINAKREQKR